MISRLLRWLMSIVKRTPPTLPPPYAGEWTKIRDNLCAAFGEMENLGIQVERVSMGAGIHRRFVQECRHDSFRLDSPTALWGAEIVVSEDDGSPDTVRMRGGGRDFTALIPRGAVRTMACPQGAPAQS